MIEVANLQAAVPITDGLVRLVERAVSAALAEGGAAPEAEVSVALVDDATILGLNRRWRGRDEPTDVLAFPQGDPDLLGDVVISLETARRQAEAAGQALEAELAWLAVHGALHLLGYDHHSAGEARAMRAAEGAALARLGLERPS